MIYKILLLSVVGILWVLEISAKEGDKFFLLHKQNYVLIYTSTNLEKDELFPELQSEETKFQFSLKKRVVENWGGTLYLGYTQKSFWQVYNGKVSKPFRETNYNPEIFFQYRKAPAKDSALRFQGFDLGFEHESNGQTLPRSRSWNRIYFTPIYQYNIMTFSLKYWERWPQERPKKNKDDTTGDDNPDIYKYYGNKEFRVNFNWGDYSASVMGRGHFANKKGGVRIDLIYPPIFFSDVFKGLSWHLQYWDGYGESLERYDQHLTRWGIGIQLKGDAIDG